MVLAHGYDFAIDNPGPPFHISIQYNLKLPSPFYVSLQHTAYHTLFFTIVYILLIGQNKKGCVFQVTS